MTDDDLDPDDLDSSERRLIDPRSIPVRFSRLKQFARSPAHYFHACQERDTDTLSKRLGTFAHALVLGQPVAPWTKRTAAGKSAGRTGKDWDAHKAANPGAVYPNPREHAEAAGMADAIRRHPIAWPMIAGSSLELELDWNFLGRACQSHLDVYRPGLLADLKTADDGDPGRFPWTARRYHYVAQLACYTEAVESLGHATPEPYIILVESSAPWPVTVLRVTERAMAAGRRQVRLWMEQLLVCEAAGEWPGYSQTIEPLDLIGEDDAP